MLKIDESMIRERKYQWGHNVKGQWVFGGVERDSSPTFITVHDRSAQTMAGLIKQWFLPGTTIISYYWVSYSTLYEGYTNISMNHHITFVDKTTGAHTNTEESACKHMWSH